MHQPEDASRCEHDTARLGAGATSVLQSDVLVVLTGTVALLGGEAIVLGAMLEVPSSIIVEAPEELHVMPIAAAPA